jgi:hypothetical protein
MPSDEELHAAALQFVRKVSGFRKPSRANQAAFDHTVTEIAAATRALLENLTPRPDQRAGSSTHSTTLLPADSNEVPTKNRKATKVDQVSRKE